MTKTSIKQNLVYCMVAMAGVTVVQFGVSSVLRFSLQSNMNEQRVMADVQTRQMFGDMKHDAIQSDLFRLRDARAAGNKSAMAAERDHLDKDIAALEETYAAIERNRFEPELQGIVDRARAARKDYVGHALKTAATIQSGQDLTADIAAFIRSFDAYEDIQDTLGKTIRGEIAIRQQSADRNGRLDSVVDWVALLVLVLVMARSALTIRRRVIVPLGSLSSSLRRMAAGDYEIPLPVLPQGDEIGEIGAAVRTFQDAARSRRLAEQETHQVVSQLSEGLQYLARKDLEFRLPHAFPSAYEELRANYNSAVAELSRTISAARVGALGVVNGVTEIRSASDDLAQRNEIQAASVGAVHREAADGSRVVGQAVEAMRQLEATADDIGQITGVIDGIAFQTNLLALNAGVEAARAGDAGKGFAVVASEVRALAQRTSEAASQIKARIERTSEQVGTGVSHVRETGQMLDRILRQLSEINDTIQQNAAMAEETTAATRSLEAEADQLGTLVKTFRTRNVDDRPPTTPVVRQLRRHSLTEGQQMTALMPYIVGSAA